jgi:hypothetical protein
MATDLERTDLKAEVSGWGARTGTGFREYRKDTRLIQCWFSLKGRISGAQASDISEVSGRRVWTQIDNIGTRDKVLSLLTRLDRAS